MLYLGYERLCRSLYSHATTPKQMKLLWSTLLNKAQDRPDFINSSHVSKTWKELCKDKKYFRICHFEEDIMSKIDESLNKYSQNTKQGQITFSQNNNILNSNIINNAYIVNNDYITQNTVYISPTVNSNNNYYYIQVENYGSNVIYY